MLGHMTEWPSHGDSDRHRTRYAVSVSYDEGRHCFLRIFISLRDTNTEEVNWINLNSIILKKNTPLFPENLSEISNLAPWINNARQLCGTQLGYELSQLDSARRLREGSVLGRSSSCPWFIIFLLLSQPQPGQLLQGSAESCGVEGCWQVERSPPPPHSSTKPFPHQTDPVSNKLLYNPHLRKPLMETEVNNYFWCYLWCAFFSARAI